jgi:hypothetical protein
MPEQNHPTIHVGCLDMAFHETEYQRLGRDLQAAHDASSFPETPADQP